MSQPASPTRTNRNAAFAAGVAIRKSEASAIIAPAPAHTPSIAAMISHYSHDKEHIYGLDIHYLDEMKKAKGQG